jgi:hypothetical protein
MILVMAVFLITKTPFLRPPERLPNSREPGYDRKSLTRPTRDIAGYRLVAGLGEGGMARVYLALSKKAAGFSKLVVLKVLRSSTARVPANVLRVTLTTGAEAGAPFLSGQKLGRAEIWVNKVTISNLALSPSP